MSFQKKNKKILQSEIWIQGCTSSQLESTYSCLGISENLETTHRTKRAICICQVKVSLKTKLLYSYNKTYRYLDQQLQYLLAVVKRMVEKCCKFSFQLFHSNIFLHFWWAIICFYQPFSSTAKEAALLSGRITESTLHCCHIHPFTQLNPVTDPLVSEWHTMP